MGEQYGVLPRAVRALRWRGWVGAVIVIAAFIAGVAIDLIGSAQRVNVLAPPVLALLAWNLAVYALLFSCSFPAIGGRWRQERYAAQLPGSPPDC